MAKKSAIAKNKRRAKHAKLQAEKRASLKAITMDREAPAEDRFAAQLKLAKLPRNAAQVRVVNRCELTGRPKAVYRRFKLSRIALRELASNGQLPGVVKSSW